MKRISKRERKFKLNKQSLEREHPEMFDEWNWLQKYEWIE